MRLHSWPLLMVVLLTMPAALADREPGPNPPDNTACPKTSIADKIYGRIQFVESFPDIRVQIVDSFPDLRVQKVSAFPDGPGKWQIVDSFPDFRVQIVQAHADLRVQYVTAFPGTGR